MKSKYMPMSEIIDSLRSISDTKATGHLYIVSSEQHTATFGLDQGRIAFLQCRLRTGEKAIPLLSKIKHGSCRFEYASNLIRKMELEDNETIFEKILSPHAQIEIKTSDLPTKSKIQNNQQEDTLSLTSEQKSEIKTVLMEEIGPMGNVVMDSIENCNTLNAIRAVIYDELDESGIANTLIFRIDLILEQTA
jgi:hypothetical protein